jgi:hypothetical protein
MREARVRTIIQEELTRMMADKSPRELPEGYHPLREIRGGMFHVVQVPFGESLVWCKLRTLNSTQLMALGNYSDIVTEKDKKAAPPQGPELRRRIIETRNYQEALAKAVMVNPAYDEVAKLVGEEDIVLSNMKKELAELAASDTSGWTFEQKETLSRRCKDLELFMGFILPDNTFDFLTSWARGNSITDIKKISDKQLLDAALLAERGNTVPHEFVQGVFAEHSKQDIDLRAWSLLDDARKNKRRLNSIPDFRRNKPSTPPPRINQRS